MKDGTIGSTLFKFVNTIMMAASVSPWAWQSCSAIADSVSTSVVVALFPRGAVAPDWRGRRRGERALRTRKLSLFEQSSEHRGLVHVITLLQFLVLKVNIDKPIISATQSFYVPPAAPLSHPNTVTSAAIVASSRVLCLCRLEWWPEGTTNA